jgi:hypothetical protein
MKLKVKYSPPANSHVFSIFSVEETKTPAILSAEPYVLHVTSTCYQLKVPSFASNHEQSEQPSKRYMLNDCMEILFCGYFHVNLTQFQTKQSKTEL